MEFKNKTYIITGASTGIGKAVVKHLSSKGANLVIAARHEDVLQELANELSDNQGKIIPVATDVSKVDEIRRMVDVAIENFGSIDGAFNNAGTLPQTKPFTEMTESDYNYTMDVDVKGIFLSMKYEIEQFLKQRKTNSDFQASIVNTSSVAGIIADPGMAPYVAAKHAVIGMTKAVGLEYIKQGIRANSLAPGLVETPMTQGWFNDPEMKATVLDQTQIGRPGTPDEIANVVAFLLSDESTFVNASTYVVDGGQTAH